MTAEVKTKIKLEREAEYPGKVEGGRGRGVRGGAENVPREHRVHDIEHQEEPGNRPVEEPPQKESTAHDCLLGEGIVQSSEI